MFTDSVLMGWGRGEIGRHSEVGPGGGACINSASAAGGHALPARMQALHACAGAAPRQPGQCP
eukprot:359722-Chlamydomonas_euryale.AAC.4